MKRILMLLLSASLVAVQDKGEDLEGSIVSKHASYDGHTLELMGSVVIQHAWGVMEAETARLVGGDDHTTHTGTYSHAQLSQSVRVKLHDGSVITSEEAEFDFAHSSGIVTSSDHVSYKGASFELQGPELRIALQPHQEYQYDIEKIYTDKGMSLSYGEAYRFETDHAMQLMFKDREAHRVTAQGHIILTSGTGQRLTTEGHLEVDEATHTIHIRPDPKEGQLFYVERDMTLLADQAEIHYEREPHRMVPGIVELTGNITLCSVQEGEVAQLGIADTITYNPSSRECVLRAHAGKKVLFVRERDALRMSADEIHVTYDPVSHEQQVKGVGHVILALSDEEQKLYNKIVHHVASTL